MSQAELPTTLPATMQAWQVTTLGEPAAALQLTTLPVPQPGAGQALIRVGAVAANFPDVLLCRGEYQVKPDLPFSPGIECSGTVVALGAGVSGVSVGDRIVVPEIGLLSEYAVVQADAIQRVPDSLDDVSAAGLTIAYQTAWFALHRRAQLRAGEWLLVHAAAGGVGSAAVQLGVAAGARVIGVVSSEAKAKVARASGAEHVLLRGDDIIAEVKRITEGDGADVVFDPVGGDAFDASTRSVAFEGRIVVIGFASGTIPSLAMNRPLMRNYSVVGLHWGLYQGKAPELVTEAHEELVRLFEAGAIAPVIDHTVPFADAPAALTALATGKSVGRIVISVSESS